MVKTMSPGGRGGRRVLPVLGALAVLLPAPGAPAQVPEPVAEVLERHGVPLADASLYVQAVDAREPLVAHRADTPRNPASVIKLLTTLGALEVLGADYTWPTEVYAQGPLRDGRLEGDLVIKGHGDPYLTPERFWRLLSAVRHAGVREVTGDLVLDQSHFAPNRQGRGDFDGRPHRVYNALPAALTLGFQATRLSLYPEARGLRVVADPPSPHLRVENRMKLVDRPCSGRHHRPVLVIDDDGPGARVRLRGQYAAGCGERSYNRLVLDPEPHLAGAFTALWQALGGTLGGGWRVAEAGEGARLLVRQDSPPLGEVIRGMNKYSNNLMSRHLLLTMGAEAHGAPATPEKGRRALADWLRRADLSLPGLVVDNGSGLSRDARISAAGVGALLEAAFAGPHMADFMASLSVAGTDGTMRRRLRTGEVAGRARIKTGSLNNVNTMAGYVLDRRGRRWAVVLMINHRGLMAWQGKQAQDALLRWVHAGPAGDARLAGGECADVAVADARRGGEGGS